MMRIFVSLLILGSVACGDGGNVDPDADATPADVCGFSADFLPFEVGYTWTYRVTDLSNMGARSEKSQVVQAAPTDPTFGDVVRQVTTKAEGRTESLLRRENASVIRFDQQDYDLANTLERSTTYEPAKIRLDETPERIVLGAMYTENYTETVVDALGSTATARTEQWEVLGVDVACSSPLGNFKCLHIKRTRTAGGVAIKEFFYARGIGKVREVGEVVVEELTACSAN